MDACFCHFNGLKVKDAAARKMIEELKIYREINSNAPIQFWVGSTEEYKAKKASLPVNTFCFITDDNSADELIQKVTAAIKEIELANTAIAAMTEKAPVDVTEKVNVSLQSTTINTGRLTVDETTTRFAYNPVAKKVDFSLSFSCENIAAIKEGALLLLDVAGGYTPTEQSYVAVNDDTFKVEILDGRILLTATEETETPSIFTIYGWYYLD